MHRFAGVAFQIFVSVPDIWYRYMPMCHRTRGSLSHFSSAAGYAASKMLRGRTTSPMVRWQRGGSHVHRNDKYTPHLPIFFSPLPFRCMSPHSRENGRLEKQPSALSLSLFLSSRQLVETSCPETPAARNFGDPLRGWQSAATACLDAAACESLLSDFDPASHALLLSQAGPGGSLPRLNSACL